VPGAVNYTVYRTEGYVTDGTDKCAFGKALIGTTSGLSFTDTEVANDRAYSYVVMAEGSNDACFSPASNCTTVTPQGQSCPNPPDITTTSLPNGQEGAAYNQMLQATGGTPPYTWSIIGSLPPGLSLDSATGVISGTADASSAGTYNFTARVDDSQPDCFDTQDLSINRLKINQKCITIMSSR
ncbi:Ig domain-containing protein, partial [bacterium]|nr:Ig domain-containing protein [bacterium]